MSRQSLSVSMNSLAENAQGNKLIKIRNFQALFDNKQSENDQDNQQKAPLLSKLQMQEALQQQ